MIREIRTGGDESFLMNKKRKDSSLSDFAIRFTNQNNNSK